MMHDSLQATAWYAKPAREGGTILITVSGTTLVRIEGNELCFWDRRERADVRINVSEIVKLIKPDK